MQWHKASPNPTGKETMDFLQLDPLVLKAFSEISTWYCQVFVPDLKPADHEEMSFRTLGPVRLFEILFVLTAGWYCNTSPSPSEPLRTALLDA